MEFTSSNIKLEANESGCEVNVARGRFESALLDLLQKDELSGSEIGSEPDQKENFLQETGDINYNTSGSLGGNFSSSRPVRKRRRKESDTRDGGGGGFHHTFVMRMFDRSVDLAQFEESSPLYPICRAWMLNQPHNTDITIKSEPPSGFGDTFEVFDKAPLEEKQRAEVSSLPSPDPWKEHELQNQNDPRIPAILPFADHNSNLGDISSPSALLSQNLIRWRNVREQWKTVSRQADARYHKSYKILKAMFEREGDKFEAWNSSSEEKREIDVVGDES